jgi:hypothetical protein
MDQNCFTEGDGHNLIENFCVLFEKRRFVTVLIILLQELIPSQMKQVHFHILCLSNKTKLNSVV